MVCDSTEQQLQIGIYLIQKLSQYKQSSLFLKVMAEPNFFLQNLFLQGYTLICGHTQVIMLIDVFLSTNSLQG